MFTKTIFTVAALSFMAARAWAADPPLADHTPADASSPAASPAALPFGAPPVREAELGAVTGREGLSQLTASDQTSVVSHNTISGPSVTGAVTFDNQAFQNLNGMAVISANSGNNVSINSSFMVNIVIGQHP